MANKNKFSNYKSSAKEESAVVQFDYTNFNYELENMKQLHFSLYHSGYYKPSTTARSVVFLGNSYYHFYYLASALRRRNWDVVTVSLDDPNSPSAKFYHGEDINLYHPDQRIRRSNTADFIKYAQKRYKLLHVANDHVLSFFPEYYPDDDPKDIIDWRNLGLKVAYTISGCNSGILPNTVGDWSEKSSGRRVCDICVWRDVPTVCSNERIEKWGKKITKYVDLIYGECLPALDYMKLDKVIREPTTMCLDPVVWHPNLTVPKKHQLDFEKDEILIFHSVGNYEDRTKNGINIKGTHAILKAVERLKNEGFPVRYIFLDSMRNREIRYIQIQADIIVDQLNFGRYGATAREGMMLGKPVICYITNNEEEEKYQLQSIAECPLINATENTVYDVMKKLVINKELRENISRKSREYALKWHSADSCAERYEYLYDKLFNGEPLTYPESWTYYESVAKIGKFHDKERVLKQESGLYEDEIS